MSDDIPVALSVLALPPCSLTTAHCKPSIVATICVLLCRAG